MIKVKALLALILMLAAVPAAAQKQDDDQVQLGTQEVLLDIVVTDGKGHPVTDLRQDEVKVYEEGEQQQITSFGLVQSAVEQNAPTPGSKPPVSIDISPFRGFNFIIVVVDRTSLNTQDLKATGAAAERFINERMQPNDLVSVFVAANRLVMVQNFTNSKQKLIDAVRGATDTGGNSIPLDRGTALGGHVQIFSDPRAGGLGVSSAPGAPGGEAPPQPVDSTTIGTGAPQVGTSNTLDTVINDLDQISADISATYDDLVLQFTAVALVQDLLALMKNYSRIPGRKSVLLYSEGFVVDGVVEGAFSSLVSTANRNNFAIYTVDAAGLRPDTQTRLSSPSGDSGTLTIVGNRSDPTLVDASGNSGLGRAERSVRTGGNGALHRLAVETGGVPLRNNNDLNRGFQAVEQDLRSYYALSYAPKNSSVDGKYRALKVEVTRKGVDVRTRKGYYATPGASVLLPFEQPVLEMLAAARPDARPNDLPIMLRVERFRSGNAWTVPISTSLQASALTPAEPADSKDKAAPLQFELDLVAVVRDTKGAILAKSSRSFLYQSPRERLDAFRQLELANMFSQPIVLAPGTYKISVAAYDPNAQKGTVVERSMLLPQITAGAPSLSSIVLSRDVVPVADSERAKAATDPLVFEGTTRIIPNATGKFVKSRGDHLVVYFRFYGAPSKQYQAKMEFVRDGQVVNASQPTPIPVTSPQGETAFAPTIPIDGLEPGAYVVHLIVVDPETSKPVADATANFRIDP